MVLKRTSVLVFLLALMCPSMVLGGWIDVQLDYDLFGHLANSDGLCASTATVNSFQYLINQYPGIYNSGLLPGGLSSSRDALALLMGSPTDQNWWKAKVQWVEQDAPGTTIFGGMVGPPDDPSGWYEGNFLARGYPTWDWLWAELARGEDVEIGISFATGPNHALTLTSLKFDDLNNDGIWNFPSETAKIDYLDPNNPTQLFESTLSFNPNMSLTFLWQNGGANTPAQATIELAYAESPVPEPCTFAFVVVGIVLFLLDWRVLKARLARDQHP